MKKISGQSDNALPVRIELPIGATDKQRSAVADKIESIAKLVRDRRKTTALGDGYCYNLTMETLKKVK